MKIYCQKCGTGVEYTLNKPKFCSGCGASFAIINASSPKIVKTIPKITQNDEEEEISMERVPDISKLDFEIDVKPNKGYKIESLIGTHNQQGAGTYDSQVQGVDKKATLESLKREAGFYPSRQSMNEEE